MLAEKTEKRVADQEKRCSKCKTEKPLSDFPINKQGKFGKNSVCKECKRTQQIEYRKNSNTESVWRENNREKVRGYSRAFYQRHKEKERIRNKIRYQELMKTNPEKIREWGRKYSKTIKGIMNYYKKNAKKRNLHFNLNLENFKKTIGEKCFYCGDVLTRPGFDRVNNKKGYIENNVAPCCSVCNSMKNNRGKTFFLNHCLKIAKNNIPTPNEEMPCT